MRFKLINFVFRTDMDSTGSTVEQPEEFKMPHSTPNIATIYTIPISKKTTFQQ